MKRRPNGLNHLSVFFIGVESLQNKRYNSSYECKYDYKRNQAPRATSSTIRGWWRWRSPWSTMMRTVKTATRTAKSHRRRAKTTVMTTRSMRRAKATGSRHSEVTTFPNIFTKKCRNIISLFYRFVKYLI